MRKTILSSVRLGLLLTLVTMVASDAVRSDLGPPVGDYQRVVLVSWDGVRRDVLYDLLEVADPSQPCWQGADLFPIDTGRLNGAGAPIYTCLPALAGIKPSDAPADSPAYGPFQVIASHTTNDGPTMTKPQHASMLSGCSTLVTGITSNISIARMPPGFVIYERLMDAFDPLPPGGRRNGYVFRTHHSADKKFVGSSIYYWAKRNGALQVATGHGNDTGANPGSLKYAAQSFARWRQDTKTFGLPEPGFFMFLHFKYTDWTGHLSGDRSKAYREIIVQTDRKLYTLMEMLRSYGWDDAAIIVTTDHGFNGNTHYRNAGRTVFNTWMAARNVHLSSDQIPLRTPEDYCASQEDPQGCLANGPEVPMPAEDVVPNVYVTDVVPTILDMFGVPWRTTTTPISGRSLYRP